MRLAATIAVVVGALAVACLVSNSGTEARVFGVVQPLASERLPVQLLPTTSALYQHWKRSGARGRKLLNLGRFLHFVPIDDKEGYDTPGTLPLQPVSLLSRYEQQVSPRNFIWVAMHTGIIRRATHVMTPAEFAQRAAQVRASPEAGRVFGHEIRIHNREWLRRIVDALPREDEAVLLNIDASYMRQVRAPVLLADLRASGLRSDQVTLCLAQDSSDVTDAERRELELLGQLWGAR